MANIFDIDFNAIANNLLPPHKRLPKFQAITKVYMKPLQYLRDTWIGDYLFGASYPYYATVTAYVVGEKVLFFNNAVIECTVAHTSGASIDLTKWKTLQSFKGGVFERLNYNDMKGNFEAVLNKYFDYYSIPGSPIYIDRVVLPPPGFFVSSREDKCSTVTSLSDKQFYFVSDNDYSTYSTTSFIIYVKLAQFNNLGSTNTEREAVVRSVADMLNSAGFFYEVTTY